MAGGGHINDNVTQRSSRRTFRAEHRAQSPAVIKARRGIAKGTAQGLFGPAEGE